MDFSTPSDDIGAGVMKVAKGILKHGCTAFCPTVITSPQDLYHKVQSYNVAIESHSGANESNIVTSSRQDFSE